MKKILAVFVFVSLIAVFWVVPVCGDAFSVSINGIDADFAYAPIVNNGCVYVEIKELFRLVGRTATWDPGKGVFLGSLGEDRLVYDPGKGILKAGEEIYYLKEAPLHTRGNTYVSLEEFAGPLDFNFQKYKSSVDLTGNLMFNPKSSNFTHYDIEAVYSKGKIYGSETVSIKNTRSKQVKDLLLVLPAASVNPEGRTKVLSVAVNDIPVEYQEGETYLKIVLPQPLKHGDRSTLEISFDTIVPQGPSRLGYTQQCAVLTCWYPVVSMDGTVPVYTGFGEPYSFQAGTYDVKMVVDSGQQVFSGLEKLEQTENGEDTAFRFSSSIPIREAAFVVGKFQTENRAAGNTTVCYAYNHRNPEIPQYASSALQLFGKWWGGYPYPSLTLVEVPLEGFHGMEYGGMVLFSSITKPDRFIVVHEVAHQWWQGLVGNNQETEAWIDEGLANYSTLLFFENTVGHSDYSSRVAAMKRQAGGDFKNLKRSLMGFDSGAEYKKNAYIKGALVWDAVRNKIGRERLIDLLRDIQEQNKYGQVTTEDIFQEIQEVAPGAVDL